MQYNIEMISKYVGYVFIALSLLYYSSIILFITSKYYSGIDLNILNSGTYMLIIGIFLIGLSKIIHLLDQNNKIIKKHMKGINE